jgi:hypothetical protein
MMSEGTASAAASRSDAGRLGSRRASQLEHYARLLRCWGGDEGAHEKNRSLAMVSLCFSASWRSRRRLVLEFGERNRVHVLARNPQKAGSRRIAFAWLRSALLLGGLLSADEVKLRLLFVGE